jgi:carbamoyl-phosphate synthase small subunit
MKAILALEDGTVYRGLGFGAEAEACGEVCFNTSMTGYQEILTDPSYKAQIVTMTYPHIGNYGVNTRDIESYQPHCSGFVVREVSPVVSNWRADSSLPDYLAKHSIPGIAGIDTRALTKKLRVTGSMKGFIATGRFDEGEAVAKARGWNGLLGVDYVKEVTHKEAFDWDSDDSLSADFRLIQGAENLDPRKASIPLPPAELPIVAMDFGIKYNILRRLRQHGFRVTVMPASTSAEEILARKPAGVFLSNGPGDPAAVTYAVQTVSELIESGLPIFGICLGHQILGQAFGGKTFKLKFGHRGGNQPVMDLESGKIEITSQNHGFAVDSDTLPENVEVSHVNLNDRTVEGLRHRSKPVFSVQYHPEASPGPHDSTPLFKRFAELVRNS